MKRLLVLAPVPLSAASTRYRLHQFFPALQQSGVEPRLRPFLDEEGFRVLYQRGAPVDKLAAAVSAVAGRLADLVSGADAVLIHREAALVGPPVLERLFTGARRLPMLFDVDDAIWVPYASPTYGALLSRLLKAPGKTHFTLGAAAHVIAGNRYVADYARRFNPHVSLIPTVVDTEQFRPPPPRPPNQVPVLGSIGTHSSAQYLRAIVPALRRLAARRKFVLRVVGGDAAAPDLAVEQPPWTLEGEIPHFQALDVGLYPLVEDAWSVGKSGFKAVQYMACGVPVVASPVGATRDIIRDGETGLFADSEDEWVERLERLVDDAALRRRLGEAGRADVEARWSLAVHAPRFVELVASVF